MWHRWRESEGEAGDLGEELRVHAEAAVERVAGLQGQAADEGASVRLRDLLESAAAAAAAAGPRPQVDDLLAVRVDPAALLAPAVLRPGAAQRAARRVAGYRERLWPSRRRGRERR